MRTPQDSEGVTTVQINAKLQGEPPFFVTIELCRMAEAYRKGTQGSVLAWKAASFLLSRLVLLY